MKIVLSTITVLLSSVAAVLAAQPSPDTAQFETLSTDDLAALTAELYQWSGTHAGQNALQHGFVPKTAENALVSLKVITTSSSAKQTITKAQSRFQIGASKSAAQNSVPISKGINATMFADSNLRELLKRFHDGKLRIAELAKTQPKATFSMQTPFALMTPEEFQEYVGGGVGRAHMALMPGELPNFTLPMDNSFTRRLRSTANPASKDWVASGKVSAVQDQGNCNACSLFSTLAAVESGYAIATGNAVPSLSEQDALSCGPMQGSCTKGGFPYQAFDWIVNYNGGSLCTRDTFPYGGTNGATVTCARYDDSSKACYKPDIGLIGYLQNQFDDHTILESVVALRPVAVLINSKPSWFQYYQGGVMMGNENECPSTLADMSHAVTIVGYDTRSDGVKYWKAKNSWSQWWGENGYFRIERGYQGAKFGACGIELAGVVPMFREDTTDADNMRCPPKRMGHSTLGTFLSVTAVQSTTECCDICRVTATCVAVNLDESGGKCTLLSSITGDQLASGVSTIIPNSKARVNSQCSPVENNVDYGGNDIMRLMTTTPGDCCDACMRNPRCTAYTWSQWSTGSCFLKSQRGTSINTHPPNADGSPYYVSGEAYKCQGAMKDRDIPGQDLSTAHGDQPYSCCGICRATTGCAAYTWTSYNGGTCWLKTGSSNIASSSGATSASVN